MKLSGKTVLITGSSRGIGREIAWNFAREGCKVVLNASKSLDELNCCYEEMRGAGYPCIKAAGDVSDYTVCQSIFREMEEKFGPVDILVNNAGISHIGLFTDMQPEEWQTIINCNLNSVFNCTHIALKTMIKKQAGVILNISSIWGERGASCEAVYSASKGGMNAFTKAIAKEAGPSGVRVNAISCGVIDTRMNQCFTAEERDSLRDEISLMRFGKPGEAADLAVFLAGEKGEYINGQIITLDGGMY